MNLTLTLTDDQIDALAERVAVKMGKRIENPLSIAEFAREADKSWATIKKWVDAGIIVKSPIPGDTLIPYSELERFRAGSANPQHA